MRIDLLLGYLILPFILVLSVLGVPTSIEVTRGDVIHDPLKKRTTPFFPDQPPSCPICAKVGSPDPYSEWTESQGS